MPALYRSMYSKEGTATGSAVQLSTTNNIKADHWVFRNTHASQALTLVILGQTVTVGSGETYEADIVAAPTQITVQTNGTTYGIQGMGR